MSPLHKWMIPAAGLAVLALTIWGVYGVGTARKNLPEKERTPSAVTVSEVPDEGSSGDAERKYNAALHRRSGPLADPFHMEAIQAAGEKKKFLFLPEIRAMFRQVNRKGRFPAKGWTKLITHSPY